MCLLKPVLSVQFHRKARLFASFMDICNTYIVFVLHAISCNIRMIQLSSDVRSKYEYLLMVPSFDIEWSRYYMVLCIWHTNSTHTKAHPWWWDKAVLWVQSLIYIVHLAVFINQHFDKCKHVLRIMLSIGKYQSIHVLFVLSFTNLSVHMLV